jgi:transcriptional regulator with XRE-family HTH domain
MRKGLTIFDVADLVGLDPMTVAAIEDGSTRASDSLLAEWDDALQRAPSHPLLWRIRRAVFHSPWDFVILALFALALVVAVALVRGR